MLILNAQFSIYRADPMWFVLGYAMPDRVMWF
jgi:hypothetical protein